MLDTLEAVKYGPLHAIHVPYEGSLMCKGCKRHIGLYNRDGELVAMEYHAVGLVLNERHYLGSGRSGLGMFSERRGYACNHGQALENT